jgi:hypothetical protein
MQDPVDIESIANATHRWFSEATGLTTVWAEQSSPQLERPFATLEPSPVLPDFDDWEERLSFDANRPFNEEYEAAHVVSCGWTLNCLVFVGPPDSRNPRYNASAYLDKALAGLKLSSTKAAFENANFCFRSVLLRTNLPTQVGATRESRGILDLSFGCTMQAVERYGYANSFNLEIPDWGYSEIIQ